MITLTIRVFITYKRTVRETFFKILCNSESPNHLVCCLCFCHRAHLDCFQLRTTVELVPNSITPLLALESLLTGSQPEDAGRPCLTKCSKLRCIESLTLSSSGEKAEAASSNSAESPKKNGKSEAWNASPPSCQALYVNEYSKLCAGV